MFVIVAMTPARLAYFQQLDVVLLLTCQVLYFDSAFVFCTYQEMRLLVFKYLLSATRVKFSLFRNQVFTLLM